MLARFPAWGDLARRFHRPSGPTRATTNRTARAREAHFAMEYVAGESLEKVLRPRKRLPLLEALSIVELLS